MSYAGKKSWRSDFWLLFRLLGGLAILLHDDDDIRQQEKKHLFLLFIFTNSRAPSIGAWRKATYGRSNAHHKKGGIISAALDSYDVYNCYWTS